jgi:alkanesulfonate monooxygenase SsuD/methylene tetrahydromethanopterin reductase-like flavin-dependent oxidoreductase (luciferase family)
LAPVLDPLLGLAVIAGRTGRLRLGANVVPLGRNPFLLAKELAQLDQLSHGRLLLSFVPGLDQPGDREALGLKGANRGAVLEEVLGLVRSDRRLPRRRAVKVRRPTRVNRGLVGGGGRMARSRHPGSTELTRVENPLDMFAVAGRQP